MEVEIVNDNISKDILQSVECLLERIFVGIEGGKILA